MNTDHAMGILEGGVSKVGEMQKIAPMIDCSLGIFANIGSAHDEGFADTEEKVFEKMLLFTNSDHIICSVDNPVVYNPLRENFGKKLITWSIDGHPAHISGVIEGATLKIKFGNKEGDIQLPFRDAASIENLMHCIATMLFLDYDFDTINQRAQWLKRLALRLELVNGIDGNLIINKQGIVNYNFNFY